MLVQASCQGLVISGPAPKKHVVLVLDNWCGVCAALRGLLALSPCGLATYDMQTEMSSIACWRFMLACWQTQAYYNILSNNSQKKRPKKHFFGLTEFFDLSRVLVCFSWWYIILQGYSPANTLSLFESDNILMVSCWYSHESTHIVSTFFRGNTWFL